MSGQRTLALQSKACVETLNLKEMHKEIKMKQKLHIILQYVVEINLHSNASREVPRKKKPAQKLFCSQQWKINMKKKLIFHEKCVCWYRYLHKI